MVSSELSVFKSASFDPTADTWNVGTKYFYSKRLYWNIYWNIKVLPVNEH